MRIYRFTHKRHAAAAWEGQGGLRASGRWHTKGRPIVYASEHAALCVLETLVHTTLDELADFRLLEADVPDRLVHDVDATRLPRGWDDAVHGQPTRAIGDAWLDAQESVALRVPSSLVPGRNVVLNTAHPDFPRVERGEKAVEINLPTRLAR